MPSDEILEECFFANPDGAGIMLAANNKVYGFKGLMSIKAFKAKLRELDKKFGPLNERAVVMHFRIGTHGGNTPQNTHPFPTSNDYDKLRSLHWKAKQGVAHNGIISLTGSDPDVKLEHVSDTMVFIKKIIAPVSHYINIATNNEVATSLFESAQSKLAFLDGKGHLLCKGDFHERDGVFYSNYSYVPKSYSMYDYDWDYRPGKLMKSHFRTSLRLSEDELFEIAMDEAAYSGYLYPPCGKLYYKGEEVSDDDLIHYAIDLSTIPGESKLMYFDDEYFEFIELATEPDFIYIDDEDPEYSVPLAEALPFDENDEKTEVE